jgi:hypothetical protein
VTPSYQPRPIRRATQRRRPPLLKLVLILVGVIPAFVALADISDIPPITRALGVVTWILTTLPAVMYLSRRPATRRPLPFIETISFVYGLYYALPIALSQVNKAWRITVDPTDGYDVAIQLVLLGWLAMMSTYAIVTYLMKTKKRPRDVPWQPKSVTKWASVFLISGVAIDALRPIIARGASIGGFIQLFVSLEWLGLGLLVVLARRGELTPQGKVILYAGFFAATAVGLAQGNISPIVLLYVVVAFALWAGRPVIEGRWMLAGGIALLIAVSFRGVVRDFRLTALMGNQEFTLSERVQFMGRLLTARIDNEGLLATIAGGGSQTAQRSANMDMFADVIRRTPSEVPYWKGETYYSLVGAAVPRFLWPDKPTKELGQAFGHRYRYIDPSNKSTAINLPILVEFYANFGFLAVIFGMAFVGSLYGIVDGIVNRPGQALMMSMIGLTLLLPLLLIESDFSLVFGGLPLSGLALWGIYTAMRRSAAGKRGRRDAPRASVTTYPQREQLDPNRQPVLPAG